MALVPVPVFVLVPVALVPVVLVVLVVLVPVDLVADLVVLVAPVALVLADQVADLAVQVQVQVLDPADPGVDLVVLAVVVRVQVDNVAPHAKNLVRVVAPSLKIFSLRPRHTRRAMHLFRKEPS